MHPITDSILASRRYRSLYPPLVERLVKQAIARVGEKNSEEAVRNLLHKTWGSYFSIRPDMTKLQKRFQEEFPAGVSEKDQLKPYLPLHSSTAERLVILPEFYKEIFKVTGPVNSIIDYGCGFNPLTLPWMSLKEGTSYEGVDIDIEEVEFLKSILPKISGSAETSVRAGDIVEDDPKKADVIFMFKLLPVLEQQQKGLAREVLLKQIASWLIVSYPVVSLSGKEKGMVEFYTRQFSSYIEDSSRIVATLNFPTELVFIVKKS